MSLQYRVTSKIFCFVHFLLHQKKSSLLSIAALVLMDYKYTTDSKAFNGTKGFDIQCKNIHKKGSFNLIMLHSVISEPSFK